MGSSLRVTPAANLPEEVGERGKRLVIVNLQGTPLDNVAALRINGLCDDVMRALMEKLKWTIPEFLLRRYVHLHFEPVSGKSGTRRIVTISGVDSDGTPMTVFETVTDKHDEKDKKQLDKEPFRFNIPDEKTTWEFTFFGHYNEPPLTLNVPKPTEKDKDLHQVYILEYNPKTGKWNEPVLLTPHTHPLLVTLEELSSSKKKTSTQDKDVSDLSDDLDKSTI